MAGENEGVDQASEMNEMNAGYSDDFVPPTETPAQEVVDAKPVATEPTPQVIEKRELTQAQIDKLLQSATEIETIKAAQQKMIDTAFGRIGRAIEDMKATGSSIQEVTIDDFPELSGEFAELAPMVVSGVNNALKKNRGAVVDPDMVKRVFADQFGNQFSDIRNAALDGLQDIVPEWWPAQGGKPAGKEHAAIQAWKATQDKSVQDLAASNNLVDARKFLRLYRDRPKPAPVKSTAAAKPSTQTTSRHERLEAAVIPRGTGGHASSKKSDLEEMQAGYDE